MLAPNSAQIPPLIAGTRQNVFNPNGHHAQAAAMRPSDGACVKPEDGAAPKAEPSDAAATGVTATAAGNAAGAVKAELEVQRTGAAAVAPAGAGQPSDEAGTQMDVDGAAGGSGAGGAAAAEGGAAAAAAPLLAPARERFPVPPQVSLRQRPGPRLLNLPSLDRCYHSI
eukprot:366292-Chlamydomonas_euryale.AAC.6